MTTESKVSKQEYLLVLAATLAGWILLSILVRPAPISSDIFKYFQVGQLRIADPFLLNRYFHIFLQKFFIIFAQTPLEGLQYFWGFMMAGTLSLVYLNARLATPKSTPLHGLLAILFLLAIQPFKDVFGIPYIDVTVMWLALLLSFLYLSFLKSRNKQSAWLVLMGIVTLFGLKTKETFLPFCLLILGIGFDGIRFSIKTFLYHLKFVFLGILIGIGVIVLLNTIFLGEPFFGFRIADIRSYFNSYYSGIQEFETVPIKMDWLYYYLIPEMFLQIVFYLFSALKWSDKPPQRKFFVLAPVFYFLFLLISINTDFGLETRFILPMIPLLCVSGAQVFPFEKFSSATSKWRRAGTWSAFLLLGFLIWASFFFTASRLNQDPFLQYDIVYKPLLFIFLTLFLVFYKQNNRWLLLFFSLIIAWIVYPVGSNLNKLFISQPNSTMFEQIVEPLRLLHKVTESDEDQQVIIDTQVLSLRSLPIIKERNEIVSAYNLLNNTFHEKYKFVIFNSFESTVEELELANDPIIVLATETWRKGQNRFTTSAMNDQECYQIAYTTEEIVYLNPCDRP